MPSRDSSAPLRFEAGTATGAEWIALCGLEGSGPDLLGRMGIEVITNPAGVLTMGGVGLEIVIRETRCFRDQRKYGGTRFLYR
ncbi:MAG: hypothetical protein ACYDEV_05785 [Acidiferrobacter sp.]